MSKPLIVACLLLLLAPLPMVAAQMVSATAGSPAADTPTADSPATSSPTTDNHGASETIRVLRDPWGVPHVLAETDEGAMYGYARALARDQLPAVLSALWTVQGRRTEIDGEQAVPFDRANRLLRVVADVEDAWDGYPDELRTMAEAFAAGLNDAMAAEPERVPAWAEPVQAAWPVALGRLLFLLPQIHQANRDRHGLGPRMATLATGGTEEHYFPLGSNAFALAPWRTESGNTLLGTDPHLPWKHEFRFHEVHLRGDSFEAAGAAPVGVPLPVFARNAHVAWGFTWNGPDHADVYQLTLDPHDPEHYMLDDESLPFTTQHAVYELPDGSAITETLRWSEHGPITHHAPQDGIAAAFRLSALGHVNAYAQLLDMLRAQNLEQLETALAQLEFPHYNVVAADVHGSIAYVWNGRVPRRPSGYDWSRPVDGSTRATLWDSTDLVPYEELPAVRDPAVGFVQNCNNGPNGTTGTDADPRHEDSEPGVIVRLENDTVRSWYLRRRLTEQALFTEDDAHALLTDGTMIPHAAMTPLLLAAWELVGDKHPQRKRLAADVELLAGWDGQPSLMSSAPTVFTVWLFTLLGGGLSVPIRWLETTPDQLGTDFARELLDALADARTELDRLSPVPWTPWGAVHVIRRVGRVVPVATGMYPAISLMNANFVMGDGGLAEVTCRVGSSYVAFHVLGDAGVKTWSVLPLGQTDRPELPWVHAMTPLYGRRELKPLPFTDAELASLPTTETRYTWPRPQPVTVPGAAPPRIR